MAALAAEDLVRVRLQSEAGRLSATSGLYETGLRTDGVLTSFRNGWGKELVLGFCRDGSTVGINGLGLYISYKLHIKSGIVGL